MRIMKNKILFCVLFLFCNLAHAQDFKSMSLKEFKQTPVIYDGRLQPMDSMARDLAKLQTKENIKSPSKWLKEKLEQSPPENLQIIDPATLSKIDTTRLKTELIYSHTNAFLWITLLYGLAIPLFLIKPKAAFITALAGTTLYAFTLAARIFILARPPVTNLYESILFVSFICVTLGLLGRWKMQNTRFLLAGLIAGSTLLALSFFAANDGNNLLVTPAVLNTNFWLATHVIIITSGYALCIITAILSHIALYKNKEDKLIHTGSILALTLVAIGTILGGIWADQSWGRFWGWDPKENGALLIILWIIWLQHGRLSGHINPRAFLAGMAALNIITALAWFGVNLLNTGMHAYGFTSGLAYGLAAFCLIETAIIAYLWKKP